MSSFSKPIQRHSRFVGGKFDEEITLALYKAMTSIHSILNQYIAHIRLSACIFSLLFYAEGHSSNALGDEQVVCPIPSQSIDGNNNLKISPYTRVHPAN
jgi:hypothetical protein